MSKKKESQEKSETIIDETPPVEEAPTDTTSVAGLADDLEADMPQVMPHTDTVRQADPLPGGEAESLDVGNPPPAEAKTQKDKAGATFDPTIHAVDDNGLPKLTKTGRFRNKTQKSERHENQTAEKKTGSASSPGPDIVKCKNHAKTVVGMMEFAAMNFTGPECGPEWRMAREEKEYLETSTGEYFVSKGIDDIPPGYALIAAWLMYVLPRLMPGSKSREKLDSLLDKMMPKNKAEIFENAYSNIGDDRNRENNASETVSVGILGQGF